MLVVRLGVVGLMRVRQAILPVIHLVDKPLGLGGHADHIGINDIQNAF